MIVTASYGNGSCIKLHPCDTSTSSSRTRFDMNIWRISAHQCCSEVEQTLKRQRRNFQEWPAPLPYQIYQELIQDTPAYIS